MADSSNFTSSSSTSSPTVFNTPQSDFLLQLGQYAQGLAQSSQQWANQAYARSSNVTDQNVADYRSVNAKAMQMAQNDTARYQQLFQPEENQLLQDANTYASPDRMKANMGAAASGQAQAGDAALANARQKLQSFGIDPSSGRYADLEASERVKTAAAAAGAAQQARLATEGTGRALRSEAIQVGERYPGQIINAQNTGLQATTGAQNAELGNENTGANVQRVPQGYVQAGMGVKLPLMGNNSQSQSHGSGQSSSPDSPGGSRSRDGSGGGSNPSYGSDNTGDFMNPNNYGTGSDGTGGPDMGLRDPQATGGQEAQGWDSGWGMGEGAMTGNTPYDPDTNGNLYGPDYGGSFGAPVDDGSGDGSFSMGFAQGGAIPDGATSGGDVSSAMSPSGGQQTDDVNAHLNADEFVIPKDVALWKGQEFFQKLIMDARAKLGQGPAHGKPAAPRPGPAAFRSQAIPAG